MAFWAVVTLVYLLPRFLPGDPLQSLDDPGSGTCILDAHTRVRVAASMIFMSP